MSGFEYSALDARGRETRGVIEADTERHARSLLRERGLAPLAVEGIRAPGVKSGLGERFARPKLSRRDLTLVTRQFATLVRAGLTIEQCFNVLIEQSDSARARSLLAAVRGRILEGQSLSSGLAEFPVAFPQIYRAMIEAGEQSGKLSDVLERLAEFTENRESLRDKLTLAFIYPALVTIIAFVVIGVLLVYVVPQVTRVFANLGQALPLPTRILIGISDFARASGAFWLAGARRLCCRRTARPAQAGVAPPLARVAAARAGCRTPHPRRQRGALRRHPGHPHGERRAAAAIAAVRRGGAHQPADACRGGRGGAPRARGRGARPGARRGEALSAARHPSYRQRRGHRAARYDARPRRRGAVPGTRELGERASPRCSSRC